MSDIYVMTPDELEALPEGSVVWREIHDYDDDSEDVEDLRLQPMVMFNGILAHYYDYLLPEELRAGDDIQLKQRFWNKKPTTEMMNNEPWVIREEWIL